MAAKVLGLPFHLLPGFLPQRILGSRGLYAISRSSLQGIYDSDRVGSQFPHYIPSRGAKGVISDGVLRCVCVCSKRSLY